MMTAYLPTLAILLLRAILSATFISMVLASVWALIQFFHQKPFLKEAPPKSPPWTWKSFVLAVCAWVIIQVGVSAGYVLIKKVEFHEPPGTVAPKKSEPQKSPKTAENIRVSPMSSTELMLVTAISNVLLLGAIPLLLRIESRHPLVELGIRREGLTDHVAAGVLGFLLITPVVYLANFSATTLWNLLGEKATKHPLEQMVRTDFTPASAVLAFISAVILAPAVEELLFRGVIQSWLARRFQRNDTKTKPVLHRDSISAVAVDSILAGDEELALATTTPETKPEVQMLENEVTPESPSRFARLQAILLTSLLFGLVHFPQWPAPVAIFVLALGLGWLYDRTGSLIPPFVMHALFNALATLGLFYQILAPDTALENKKPQPAPAQKGSALEKSTPISKP